MHRCGGGVLIQLDSIHTKGGRKGGKARRMRAKGKEGEDLDKERRKKQNRRVVEWNYRNASVLSGF